MSVPTNQKLLIISGDVSTRRQIADLAEQWFTIHSTPDAQQALSFVASDASVAVVVADHSSGRTSGVAILERVRTIRDDVRRVLIAETDDFASLIVGLHSGAIEQLVHKPINSQALFQAIQPGVRTDKKKKLSA